MLRRFLRYIDKRYRFGEILRGQKDYRVRPVHSSQSVLANLVALIAMGRRSFNAWEGRPLSIRRKVQAGKPPSADTLGYALARWDVTWLHEWLLRVARLAKRSKAMHRNAPVRLWVASVDGHELFASRYRCCPECLVRQKQTKRGTVTEYFHRLVVVQMVGVEPPLLLGVELQRRGEDEVGAAIRLLERLLGEMPRLVDVWTLDGLYAQARLFRWLMERHQGVIAALKDDRRELYRDMEGLMALASPQLAKDGDTAIALYDEEQLSSWSSLGRDVRVVVADERKRVRHLVGGKRVEKEEHSVWWWVTTLSKEQASGMEIRAIGHARWDEENRGFNELSEYWQLDHCFHHHPRAILAMSLVILLVINLLRLFYTRNLKPQARKGLTYLELSARFCDALVEERERVLPLPP